MTNTKLNNNNVKKYKDINIVNINPILKGVEKPGRYIGCEKNAVKKDLNNIDLTFGFAFPDLYEIGTVSYTHLRH